MNLLRLFLHSVTILILPFFAWAQFPPPAGQPGSTAIFKDSSIIINWAKTCSANLGYVYIADTNKSYGGSNKANYGVESDAIGKADDHVISLGDGGTATLTFDPPIKNGQGFDFAVFENGMNDTFLELGFVEVSSDGLRFVRFPSISLTPENVQVPTFGFLDATKIYNLAGKYRVFYGSPFDLEEIKDSTGVDIMRITHVRIRDVVGCVNDSVLKYVSFDSQGHRINDPWPTIYHTGGFDLDAVGVIHEVSQTLNENLKHSLKIYPNPCQNQIHITFTDSSPVIFNLLDLFGEVISQWNVVGSSTICLSGINKGLYIGQIIFPDGKIYNHKIVKQ